MNDSRSIRYDILDDKAFHSSQLHSIIEKSCPTLMLNKIHQFSRVAIGNIIQDQPDLLFLDVEMPEFDGFEVHAKLKEANYNGKVIFTTAFDKYILEALRANAFDYLVKPVDSKDLKQAIDRYKMATQEESKSFDNLSKYGLSIREIDVAKRIFQGLTSKQIGEDLFISKNTVDTHRRNILAKTNCKNTTELFKLL